ncbi:MAG: 1-acyl-sn-glycerol-3-phosphate acyltransferase [Treponema sp.]|jgi:glycerol-3-phosphate O-acyltransferase|nr:1-acyl-sn-glycerol-3-phosphate acyltransferase [Treponema sp.]
METIRTLNSAFQAIIKQVMSLSSKTAMVITEHNVYQEGFTPVVPFLDKMISSVVLPGSGISGMEYLKELYEKAESGKSCLLLMEHYSNMDLPLLSYLLRKEPPPGKAIAKSLVAIAGMKLTEEDPTVAAFARAYTRIIIYPSRSLQGLDPEKNRDEIIRSNAINRAAMKALLDIKDKGKIILVFPSGTRYRPWDPSTKKGVREIDSYIKSFDYMCCMALNGSILKIGNGDMMDDIVDRDVIRLTAGPVQSCAEFRNASRTKADVDGIEDKKQATVDDIMRILEEMHNQVEPEREKLLSNEPNAKRD